MGWGSWLVVVVVVDGIEVGSGGREVVWLPFWRVDLLG